MSLNRTKVWLTAWVLTFLMGSSVFAQGVRDMALFAPADLSTYGGGIRPREGLFINLDYLYWGIPASPLTPIGDAELGKSGKTVYIGPSTAESYTEYNSLDTGFLKTVFTNGTRFEIGDISEHHGWLLGGFFLSSAEQNLVARDAHILFKDSLAESGTGYLEGWVDENGAFKVDGHYPRLPTIFNYLSVTSQVSMYGLELSYLYRTHPCHHGGIFEFMCGVRYLDFRDTFRVTGMDAPPTEPKMTSSGSGIVTTSATPENIPYAPWGTQTSNILADSYWDTTVDNELVGPQVGIRHFQTWGRWTLVTEARFCAALNTQNYTQTGLIGNKLNPGENVGTPLIAEPTWISHSAHRYRFSPITECRVEALLEITKTISLGAGWNGMYIGNVARAANSINYEVPSMGLNLDDNEQSVFVNGLSLKLIINR